MDKKEENYQLSLYGPGFTFNVTIACLEDVELVETVIASVLSKIRPGFLKNDQQQSSE